MRAYREGVNNYLYCMFSALLCAPLLLLPRCFVRVMSPSEEQAHLQYFREIWPALSVITKKLLLCLGPSATDVQFIRSLHDT